ncbi:hypothetical protein [Synechococcus sp. CBW1107]|uniref:hypothetical protein n=1 Tax=Synechococcus sp. CBW1107 TaxID=2789857 RepID=UPI002AD48251|nr:hypothetical protein [Synechococcus sp. CBW1107]CAK6686513.1 hypothetical protein IFHNHDMJ_00014 [Synechococcus sp. CBW1107]
MPFSGFSTGELIPALVRQGLQALIEAELQQPSVRTATSARRERRGHRNGSCGR